MNKAIIFDLDGTLWDSSKEVIDSWNIALDKCHDVDFRLTVEDMQNLMGKTIDEIAKILFFNKSEQRQQEIMKECMIEEEIYLRKHGGILFPELENTLEELSKSYKLFIVSNCQEGYIETFLEYYNLEKYFLDIENAGRTKKPKGENIKLIIERNKLNKAVYVGDTQGDYEATKIAGIPFIHAKYGFGKINEETYFINEISELPALVSSII